jgi:hypothetical protein
MDFARSPMIGSDEDRKRSGGTLAAQRRDFAAEDHEVTARRR